MQTDQELATRVVMLKDQQAFRLLVERHQAAVRAFLRRLLAGDHAAADDLAQETFLAVHRKLYTWQATAQFSTWLHSVAYRKFLERVRRENRYQVMEEVPEPESPPSSAMGNAAESEILVQQLMALLSPEDRACLTLAYSVGLSLEEISAMMDLPVGSVKSRIHRAKLKLQQWMDDHDHSLQTTETGPQPGQRHAG